MGDYLNPSSPRYEKLKKSKVFVDKTDIFEILNENLGKEKSFFCLSRPRCFGKSVTAQMSALTMQDVKIVLHCLTI